MDQNNEILKSLQEGYEVARAEHAHLQAIGSIATQGAEFAAETTRIVESGHEELQERQATEQRIEDLRGATNARLTLQVFETIHRHIQLHTNNGPLGSIGDSDPHFAQGETWIAHQRHTQFLVPPEGSELGRTHIRKRRAWALGLKLNAFTRRPIPFWPIGEQYNSEIGEWEYLAITPLGASKEVYDSTTMEPSPFRYQKGAEFALYHLKLPDHLDKRSSFLPSAAEVNAAYDSTSGFLRSKQYVSPEQVTHYPHITAMAPVGGAGDIDMQNFGVPERLMSYLAAYDVPEAQVQTLLHHYSKVRDQIAQWDGSPTLKSLCQAFGDLDAPTYRPLFEQAGIFLPAKEYTYPTAHEKDQAIWREYNGYTSY